MTTNGTSHDVDAVRRFRAFYDTFSAAWLGRLPELYAPDFEFADPFHRIRGDFVAMKAYFTRVLALPHNQFTTLDTAFGDDGCYVRWQWDYKLRPKSFQYTAEGMTHLRFRSGAIVYHRDIFDAAGDFYEHLPVVGGVLRFVKRRL